MPAGSTRIGSIYGISIELDQVFVFLSILAILFSLFVVLIGQGLSLLVFVLILVLLFVCVLVHELAHAVTAMANGIKVKRIILTIWGGFTVMDTNNVEPKVEFRISVVGPLMSLFLGGIFGILSIITPPGIIEFIIQQLFVLNIFLGLLNLVPAFPLDGGRVFRSWIRKRYDEFNATRITVKVSKIMLILIMVATVAVILIETNWPFFRKELIFVIDLLVVWFLWGGAKAEQEISIIKKHAGKLNIKRIVSKNFSFIQEDKGVSSLYKIVNSKDPQIILTKLGSDYAMVDLSKLQKVNAKQKVAALAYPIPSIAANTPVIDALTKMESDGLGLAAVISNGRLIGIITYTQVRAYISLHLLNKAGSK